METLPKSEVGARFRKEVGSFFCDRLRIIMTIIHLFLTSYRRRSEVAASLISYCVHVPNE